MSDKKIESAYHKKCPYEWLDAYRLQRLYEIPDGPIFHAFKKLLCAGQRGMKDVEQDYREAVLSIERWFEMRKEDKVVQDNVEMSQKAKNLGETTGSVIAHVKTGPSMTKWDELPDETCGTITDPNDPDNPGPRNYLKELKEAKKEFNEDAGKYEFPGAVEEPVEREDKGGYYLVETSSWTWEVKSEEKLLGEIVKNIDKFVFNPKERLLIHTDLSEVTRLMNHLERMEELKQ